MPLDDLKVLYANFSINDSQKELIETSMSHHIDFQFNSQGKRIGAEMLIKPKRSIEFIKMEINIKPTPTTSEPRDIINSLYRNM